MEKILNSAMAIVEIEKLTTRKSEIAKTVEEKRSAFETADVETRDGLVKEVENLVNEGNSIDEKITQLEELRAKYEEQERAMGAVGNLTDKNIQIRKEARKLEDNPLASKEYNKVYADYLRSGNKDNLNVYLRTANLATTTDNVPIPTIMQGFVETAWEKYGKFSRIVRETFIKGIINVPVEKSADDAVWHDENAAEPTQETITLDSIMLKPKMIKKWIALTDELMAMAPEEFLQYVADELVYKVVLALDHAIISRTDAGGNGVIGIVGNANTATLTKALSFNVVNEAIAEIESENNLLVAMNKKTFFQNFMGLTDTTGRPIYQIIGENTEKARYFLNGIPVEFTNAIPAYDTVVKGGVYAVVGDFARGYRLNYPNGREVSTLIDPYTGATEDVVKMVGKLFVAGNVVKLKHFAQLKKPTE